MTTTIWIIGAIITAIIGMIVLGYLLTDENGRVKDEEDVAPSILCLMFCAVSWPIAVSLGALCGLVWCLFNVGKIMKKINAKKKKRKTLLDDVNKLMEK